METVAEEEVQYENEPSLGTIEFGEVIAEGYSWSKLNEQVEEEEDEFVSIFDILDAPRELPEPVELTVDHLDQINKELGLIKLCWPVIEDPYFENRVHFPDSYLQNSDKEKLVLFYAENFRQQFHHKYPNRKPLFLAVENECGQMKMVCTTLRPTKLPHTEIEQWKDCASFVGDHLIYEPLETPTLIINGINGFGAISFYRSSLTESTAFVVGLPDLRHWAGVCGI